MSVGMLWTGIIATTAVSATEVFVRSVQRIAAAVMRVFVLGVLQNVRTAKNPSVQGALA